MPLCSTNPQIFQMCETEQPIASDIMQELTDTSVADTRFVAGQDKFGNN